jgi:hypothetical protein
MRNVGLMVLAVALVFTFTACKSGGDAAMMKCTGCSTEMKSADMCGDCKMCMKCDKTHGMMECKGCKGTCKMSAGCATCGMCAKCDTACKKDCAGCKATGVSMKDMCMKCSSCMKCCTCAK